MGEFGKAELQNVLLADNSSIYSTDASTEPDYVTEAEEYADVVIKGDKCKFSDFDAIKDSTSNLLSYGTMWGFSAFPIKKGAFKNNIVSTLVTEEDICNALLSEPDVDDENHNKVRNKLKSKRVSPEDAWEMGVSADRIQVKKSCPSGYDWENSPLYSGAESCDEVWEEINGYGVPALLYAVDMKSAAARKYIDKISTASLYSEYSKNEKPVKCGEGKVVINDKEKSYIDTFNDFPIVDFIIRSYWGKRWSAWNHQKSCDGYEVEKLMFNFGMRVFVPITVDEGDGNGPVEKTIVISSIAAAPNMAMADLFGWIVPEDLPYERFIGGETAKKILMDAKGKGWEIK